MSTEIRTQRESEWAAVVPLIDEAFAPHRNAGDLARRVHASGNWIAELSFVAVDLDTDRIVGQVLFSTTPMRSVEGAAIDVLTLTPLAVAANYRGRGIARMLIEHGLNACASRSEPLVVLEGDPGMYARLGFGPAKALGIERPSDLIPGPAFQVVTLPAYESDLRGVIEYTPYFYEVDAVGP